MNIRFWKLPIHRDQRGGLCAIEWEDLPFVPRRAYFLFDAKGIRGGHAHRREQEVFVCVQGSLRAQVHDGRRWRRFTLNRPGRALFTASGVWHQFDRFRAGTLLLALSSTPYRGQKGYIMDFGAFLKWRKKALWRKKSS